MERYGLEIGTEQDVYEPAEDTFLCAEHLISLIKKERRTMLSVLDMGCGSGMLGLIAAKSRKVRSVLLCDVNEKAIDLAKRNYEANKPKLHSRCEFMCTDLFAKIPKPMKFDLLIFNTPYLPREPAGSKFHIIEKSYDGGKSGIEIAYRFLKQALPYTKEHSKVLIISSSFADLSSLIKQMPKLGYDLIEERKKHIFFEDIVSILLLKR